MIEFSLSQLVRLTRSTQSSAEARPSEPVHPEPELAKIGLVLINVNIKDITDASGYIEATGRKAASEAVQQAGIDVAGLEKMGAIGVAEAKREKAIQVANAEKTRDIGTKEADRERSVRIADLDKEKVVGEQQAAFEQEAQVKDAEREKRIRVAEAEAEKRAIEAQGEAAAIFARLEAEAKGQYEMLAKKGLGFEEIIKSCGGAPEGFQMLMLEQIDKLSETAATAISNIKFDKVVVWDGGNQADGSPGGTAGFLKNLAGSLPPALQMMQDIGGIEMPDYFAKLVAEDPDPKVEPAADQVSSKDSPEAEPAAEPEEGTQAGPETPAV